jgi:hypothetical protein
LPCVRAHPRKTAERFIVGSTILFLFTLELKGRIAFSLAKIFLADSGSCDAGRAPFFLTFVVVILLIVNGIIAFLR